jgi:succinate dehydrogenase / fumarate reductase cytochrome b subunit
MSISHRITGIIITSLFIILVACSHLSYLGDSWFLWYSLGKIVNLLNPLILLAVTGFTMYHFWNGIRHLIWNLGWGFQLNQAYTTGYLVLALTALSTGACLFLVYFMGFL